MLQKFPDLFALCTSHTTRDPRPGEVDGVHYHFSTREAMSKMIRKGEFLEYADVHGNFYGTSFAAVKTVTEQRKVCVLDIDVKGAESVKLSDLNARYRQLR